MQKTFDCHQKTYFEVEDQFENWLLVHQDQRPLHVITGRSDKMKSLVMKEIKKHEFQISEWHYNPGLIIVL